MTGNQGEFTDEKANEIGAKGLLFKPLYTDKVEVLLNKIKGKTS